MRNYELIEQLYRSLLTAENAGPGIKRNSLIEESINLVERERPELKDNKHTDGCGYDD